MCQNHTFKFIYVVQLCTREVYTLCTCILYNVLGRITVVYMYFTFGAVAYKYKLEKRNPNIRKSIKETKIRYFSENNIFRGHGVYELPSLKELCHKVLYLLIK